MRSWVRGWSAVGSRPLIVLLPLVFVVEKLSLLYLPPSWMLGWVHRFSGAPVLFFVSLAFFGRKQLTTVAHSSLRIDKRWLTAHLATLVILGSLHACFYQGGWQPGTRAFTLVASLWTLCIPLAIVTLLAAAVPLRVLRGLPAALGNAWFYAAATTAVLPIVRRLATGSVEEDRFAFGPALHRACYTQCRWLFTHLFPNAYASPKDYILGTPRFLAQVNWLCSGVEGLFIVAVLVCFWLITVRRELRMWRAVWIMPIALSLTWGANVVRIVVLLAIGNAGHPMLAERSFHAQAGWITLNLVALGCLLLLERVSWFRKGEGRPTEPHDTPAVLPNYAVVYLLPFAATTAASLVTQAFFSGFEWLYPLRVLTAGVALWAMRRHYRAMDWTFGWLGIMAGLVVATVWLGVALLFPSLHTVEANTALALQHVPAVARWGWIAVRVFGAAVTVPIIEELAFRGFLARRLVRADFEQVAYRDLTPLSLLGSSAAFGALHGNMWAPGVVAGAVFWAVTRWRGRLGEAVAAHAVANLVLAVLAVARKDYSLW